MSLRALSLVVDDRIWTLERPVWFAGVRLRVKTTVIRLEDGSLLLHSPAPPTQAMTEELQALGTVRWLVIPNGFHHLGTPAAVTRFPEARVIGPASVRTKNAALPLDLDIADPQLAEQLPEFEALPLSAVPFLDETVLYHRPTETLIGTDIALQAGPMDHFTWRWAARIVGCYARLRVPPDVKKKLPDKPATARALQAMLDRPAKRLILGHSEVVGENWRDALAQAWRIEGVNA